MTAYFLAIMKGRFTLFNLKLFKILFVLAFIPNTFSEISFGPDGKPNLNGVWQVMNRANFNLEAHSASAAMQLVEGPIVPLPHPDILALGAVGSVPAGLGVVEGGEIPYKKSALKIRNQNKEKILKVKIVCKKDCSSCITPGFLFKDM